MNKNKHVEYYNNLHITAYEEFLIAVYGTTFGFDKLSFSDYIDSDEWVSVGDGHNIKYDVNKEIDIAVYFDRNAGTVHFTSPDHAAADEYAQEFLNATSVCDATGATNKITTKIWSDLNDGWDLLSAESKAFYDGVAAKTEDEGGNYIEQCVARYDYIVNKYGSSTYANFMNRTLNPVPGTIGQTYVLTNSGAIIISVIAATIVAIALGTIYLTKRKHD